MRRVVVSLVLCVLLVWGSVWSLRTVERAAGAVANEIEAGRLTQAHQIWEDCQTLLGSLLLHEEIDQADRLFDRVLAEAAAGQTDALAADCAELLAQLRHLPELQRPSLKNLL